jgi:TM2 domain-containing membrane protein YozV
MNTISIPPNAQMVSAENKIAAVLSIVPGLGQIYKGHYASGFIWMFVGMPVAIWVGILLGLATAGLGLLVPIACWAALAFDAYYERDLCKHHWLMPYSDGTEEEDLLDD